MMLVDEPTLPHASAEVESSFFQSCDPIEN
jgi:hypothetical protein